jgi:hypothetical protein
MKMMLKAMQKKNSGIPADILPRNTLPKTNALGYSSNAADAKEPGKTKRAKPSRWRMHLYPLPNGWSCL